MLRLSCNSCSSAYFFLILDLLEIGVHIADVSFFVHPGNKLDLFASQRATSVYLVQKVRTCTGLYVCNM